ncbi:aldo/keto reductase [Pseudomonas sp. PDM31]|uniref:aldo/keto reductase n=1 Tax=Pseudomonas sp. PDM31 TaxID=2854778 RepID=UPI001C43B9C2|nr:aldo/keto reductase [Pseudomonas sp. PDM31]MBV7477599.1 aldo/keto reductase [Pseudomonas sp. PDM31]
MQYVNLGQSGLKVSRLCLGCMTYGEPGRGTHGWTMDEASSRPLLRQAIELGINFFDTANGYSDGTSEEIVGRALKDFGVREDFVLATKVYTPMRKAPNSGGLSRKAIMQSIDDSLRRLRTDYVDLYQIHRWDYHTPIEETLEALHDIVKAGKVRYIGASSMYAWQFAKALYTAERHGWTRFISMQNHLNLLNREEEREMLPLCAAEGVGVIPWSPLARGRLTRDWNASSERQQNDAFGRTLYQQTEEADRRVIEAVAQVAERRGTTRAQVAMAWLAQKSQVTAPIIGASKVEHLNDAVAALTLSLDASEREELEAAYIPHSVVGFQ